VSMLTKPLLSGIYKLSRGYTYRFVVFEAILVFVSLFTTNNRTLEGLVLLLKALCTLNCRVDTLSCQNVNHGICKTFLIHYLPPPEINICNCCCVYPPPIACPPGLKRRLAGSSIHKSSGMSPLLSNEVLLLLKPLF